MRRILVVKLASLGDLLTATPALRALRLAYPTAHLAVLATPASAPVLRGLDSVDEIIPFDKFAFDRPADAARGLPQALRLARRLRDGRWDALALLHHLTTTFGVAKYAALALASGAPVRAGLDNGRGRAFLTRRVPDHGYGARHEADYWLAVAGALGATPLPEPRLEIAPSEEDRAWAAAHLPDADRRPTLLVAPGSGAFSPARRWMPERFAAVARDLARRHALRPLVLEGTAPDERDLARQVAGRIGGEARTVPSAPGPLALGALIARSRLLVANDSGPVHLAAAVGTPVVAVFGPTNEHAWGPYPPTSARHQVVRQPLACAPCIHRGHDFGTPAGCAARTCLRAVEPDDVLAAAERALAA